jgi:hypothetical protein
MNANVTTPATSAPTLPAELLDWFRNDAFPLPPLPGELTSTLEETSEHMYQSAPDSDGGPDDGKFLRLGFVGHGIQSWRFQYHLEWPGLSFRLDLPYAPVFGDPEMEKARLAQGFDLVRLCLTLVGSGLPIAGWEGAHLEVEYDENVCLYRCSSPSGETLIEGERLEKLLDMLQSAPSQNNWIPA